MITTRIKVNLVAFVLVSITVITWSATTLFEFDRLENPTYISAEFDSSPGLSPGFEVTYLGTSVGTIASVRLEPGKSVVEMKIDRSTDLPAAVDAAARRKSAIGEPFVDLEPSPGTDPNTGPRLAEGLLIPLERTTSPVSYGDLFTAIDGLIAAVDPEALGVVVRESAASIDGRGDDLRRIIIGARDFTADTTSNADEIDRFLGDLHDIAAITAEHADAIGSSLDDLGRLSETLDRTQESLDRLVDVGPGAITLFADILQASEGALLCTLSGLGSLEDLASDELLAALSSTIDDASELNQILADAVSDDGFVRLLGSFATASESTPYAEPVPVPVAPTVPACPEVSSTPFTPTPQNGTAPLGGGGTRTGADGQQVVPDRPGIVVDALPSGTSELGEPDEAAFIRILRRAIPIAAAAMVLFAAGAAAWRNRDLVVWNRDSDA